MMKKSAVFCVLVGMSIAAIRCGTAGSPQVNLPSNPVPTQEPYPAPTPTPQPTPAPKPIPTPTPSNCVAFAAVQPVLASSCVTCHSGFANYLGASAAASEMARRINLPSTSPGHMPLGGTLSAGDVKTFADWVKGGAPNTCGS